MTWKLARKKTSSLQETITFLECTSRTMQPIYNYTKTLFVFCIMFNIFFSSIQTSCLQDIFYVVYITKLTHDYFSRCQPTHNMFFKKFLHFSKHEWSLEYFVCAGNRMFWSDLLEECNLFLAYLTSNNNWQADEFLELLRCFLESLFFIQNALVLTETTSF